MKDPEITPLDPSLARLLGAERARPGPDAAAREAVWSRLAAALPLGPGPGGAPPGSGPPAGDAPGSVAAVGAAPPAGGPFTLVGRRAAGALAAMFVAGGVTGAVLVAQLRSPAPVTASLPAPLVEPRAAPSGAVAASAPAPEAPAGAALPPAAAADSASSSSATTAGHAAPLAPSGGATAALSGATGASASGGPAASGAPAASGGPAASGAPAAHRDVDLAAERSLLDEARAALARGEGGRCLSALGRHQSEFPGGRLSLEREVLTIQALVVSGRRDEAVRRAKAFRAAHPKSLLWPAIEASVGPIP